MDVGVDRDFQDIPVHEGFAGEMMGLKVFPIAFDVVEFGRIFRQPSGREPVLALDQRGARCFAGMDGPIVQNDGDGFARHPRLGPWMRSSRSSRAMKSALCLVCEILDLRFHALPDEITACHSSLGGEFGEWSDVVKDASFARAGAAGVVHP